MTKKIVPDEQLLPLCKELIKTEIATLNDIPRALANTLANEYYRFIMLAAPHIKERLTEKITLSLLKEELLSGELNFGSADETKSPPKVQLAAALAAVEAIAQFIGILRGIDKEKDPIQYRSTVELITDYLKYDIEDAGGKLLLKRFFERAVKKTNKQIKEQIPDLIDYIDM
ncbi:MAG: hypothetical protein L7F77_02440 [Candidatus Magnetominusculus sp. LBB02]|nr:hypothetical protein [Candidatus Magnetominusculus sp. LBB02]